MGTCAAVMFSFGVMAQYPATINTNYVEATAATLQTTGYGLTLYVAPDPIYSPGYDGDGTPAYNSSSWWLWSLDNFATAPLKEAQENFVVIPSGSLAEVGSSITVSVLERMGAAAGCEGSIVTQTITTTGAPTADIAGTGGGDWTSIGAGIFTTCTAGSTDDIDVTFTESGVAGADALYTYGLTLTVTTYDAAGGVVSGPTTTTPVTADKDALVASPITYTTPALTLVGGNRTKYEYTLTASSIGSQISGVSQYRANPAAAYSYYTGAATVLTYWVNLPPVTGPIYHIPNNFNF